MHEEPSSDLLSFRINLHGEVQDNRRDAPGAGKSRPQANPPKSQFSALGGSFEALCQQLAQLPRAHVELDGSFVLRGDSEAIHIDGMVYDAGGSVQYLQLQGTTDRSTWQQLIQVLSKELDMKFWIQDLSSGKLRSLNEFEARHWSSIRRR